MASALSYISSLQTRSRWNILLVLFLLFLQAGLYVWMAPRGFEFTDESYYFLNYLYWRDFVGVVSFFGAYFEWPFRILGQNIAAIRIFGLLILLGSSVFFIREVFSYISQHEKALIRSPLPYVVAGTATSMFYFGYLSTLRAPSYNLLALCSMLLATGLLLNLLKHSTRPPKTGVILLYGLTIGACGLGKPSTGVLLVFFHALFFAFANRNWQPRFLLKLITLSLVGVSFNFILLQWAHPQWLALIKEGAALFSYSEEMKLLDMVQKFGLEIIRILPKLIVLFVGAILIILLAKRLGSAHAAISTIFVTTLIGSTALGLSLMREGHMSLWMPLVVFTVFVLWGFEVSQRKGMRWTKADQVDLLLIGLLFALPFAFSFGTSMPLLGHSQKAAIFAVTAILIRLYRIHQQGMVSNSVIGLCLALLCLPTLVIQLKAALDVQSTYRQLSALGKQTIPYRLSTHNTILVDAKTHDTFNAINKAALAAGYEPGQTILDFTGDGPGLVFALGGRPLGLPWLLGGYSGSEVWAVRMLDKLSAHDVQNAWILSSNDNPRAIKGWQKLLSGRLGPNSHLFAATALVHTPYRWGENTPDNLHVQIWKPRPNSKDSFAIIH